MTLPKHVRDILPGDTAETWETIAPLVPDAAYLGGGTALAVHLQHRVSQDMDFFYHDNDVDLEQLETRLSGVGTLNVDRATRGSGTLNATFHQTKLQFLHADEKVKQHRLAELTTVAGIQVASVEDIVPMKLTAIADRGTLRDYFDLMVIEERTGCTAEKGLWLLPKRYEHPYPGQVTWRVLRALEYFDDVDEDALVPTSKQEVVNYWLRRHPQIVRSLG